MSPMAQDINHFIVSTSTSVNC